MLTEKGYVLYNSVTEKFVAVDYNSGGYPYDTELRSARIFHNKSEAEEYRNMFLSYKGNCIFGAQGWLVKTIGIID